MNPLYILAIIVLVTVYVWTFYQVPILAASVKRLRRLNKKGEKASPASIETLPLVSIVVPVKDEEKVVNRLLDSLFKLDYPHERKEILIVEDGSTDKTVKICQEYAKRYSCCVRFLRKSVSNGKPSALNYALKHAKGEILAVFDADNVPEPDALKKAVAYFRDPSVAAVQGRLRIINAEENMLTKFISHEETAWCEAYLKGKDALNLFVHLKGSCQFIRRNVLEQIGGFNGEALSEDMDLSVRLIERGYKIRYASDVRSWQETPSHVRQLFKQRVRWFRGTMEIALKYGKLMAKPNMKNFDAELTLLGPFILIASLTSYLLAFYSSFAALNFDFILQFLMRFAAFGTSVMLVVCGLALVYVSKPRKLTNLLWLPFIYFYWSLQAFIALYAAILLLFRRPRKWVKTEKKGTVAK